MKNIFLVSALLLGASSAMAATYTDKEGNEYTFKKHASGWCTVHAWRS